LYETREAIAYPLLIIYNKSISLGHLPADWKLAEVTAIYKKGSKSDAGNYRPVSLTSVCCKVLESILRDHIIIGADFRFEVPGQSSVGLIGGGRGQWSMGRAPSRVQGQSPWSGGKGGEAPLKLKAFWSLDVQRSRQI